MRRLFKGLGALFFISAVVWMFTGTTPWSPVAPDSGRAVTLVVTNVLCIFFGLCACIPPEDRNDADW